MNDQFTRQAQDMFAAAKEARIPENVQAFAEDSVAKTRDAYSKINAATQGQREGHEEIMLAAQAGAKTFGEKMLHTATRQCRGRLRRRRSHGQGQDAFPRWPACRPTFFQQQMAAASAQTKEFFELSNKIGRQTLESMNAVASKTFEQMKNGRLTIRTGRLAVSRKYGARIDIPGPSVFAALLSANCYFDDRRSFKRP